MATSTENSEKMTIEKAADKMIDFASNANQYVLDTTEQAFDASFRLAHKSLDLTSRLVKKGLAFTASQQEMTFDMLNGIKKKVFKA